MKALTALAICIVSLAGISGCATSTIRTGAESTQGPVSIALLSDSEIKRGYGWSLLENPYLAYHGPLVGGAYDFLVFRLTVASPTKTELELLGATAEDEKGKAKAAFFDSEKFTSLTMQAVENAPNNNTTSIRENKVAWYYLPSGVTEVEPGQHAFVFVLVGKHPLPDSLTARIKLSVNGQEQDFDFALPDAQ